MEAASLWTVLFELLHEQTNDAQMMMKKNVLIFITKLSFKKFAAKIMKVSGFRLQCLGFFCTKIQLSNSPFIF